MTADELDALLKDRFSLSRADMITALKTLPAHRPWAAALTAEEAHLLDEAGFVEDHDAYTEIAVDVVAHMARLISTAYTSNEVASGLGVNESRIRQRRLRAPYGRSTTTARGCIRWCNSTSWISTAAACSSPSVASTRYCRLCRPICIQLQWPGFCSPHSRS